MIIIIVFFFEKEYTEEHVRKQAECIACISFGYFHPLWICCCHSFIAICIFRFPFVTLLEKAAATTTTDAAIAVAVVAAAAAIHALGTFRIEHAIISYR